MTAQGGCQIEIIRQEHGAVAGPRSVCARLLTPELERLISRQNINVSEINCMKWPVRGLSRWASCKLLMLKSDLMHLLQKDPSNPEGYNSQYRDGYNTNAPDADSNLGFTIWFIVGSTDQSASTRFTRMHLAKIIPLMTSEFGLPEFGESMYIAEFRCDRWKARNSRILSRPEERIDSDNEIGFANSFKSRRYGLQTVSPTAASAAGRSPSEFVASSLKATSTPPWDLLNLITGTTGNVPLYNLVRIQDEVDLSKGSTSWRGLSYIGQTLDDINHRPYGVVFDQLAHRYGTVFTYMPDPSGLMFADGRYKIKSRDLSVKGFTSYPTVAGDTLDVTADVIAGAHNGFLDSRRFTVCPEVIYEPTRSSRSCIGLTLMDPPDGEAPNVFFYRRRQQILYPGSGIITVDVDTSPRYEGEIDNGLYLNRPFRKTLRTRIIRPNTAPQFSGESGERFYRVDDVDASTIGATGNDWGIANSGDEVAFVERRHLDDEYSFDLWLRGWLMPSALGPNREGCVAWAELRLQTDSKGFGFPTTRFYSDRDDWLVCWQEDTGQTSVESMGMVQTYVGIDGRTRVCVNPSLPIPCILEIIDNEQIGDNCWKYRAKIVRKDKDIDGKVTAGGFYSGIEVTSGFDEDEVVICYNLNEVGNGSAFAGPGYKLPLSQAGFSVLPIGQDRDGTKSPVIVLAHLMRSFDPVDANAVNRTVGYFSMHNAIDGACVSPITLVEDIDGGVF